MNTLTKLALGLMGQSPTRAAVGEDAPTIRLPAPDLAGGKPLMQALAKRQSRREAYAFTAAGAMAQNVYLYCASAGLATALRAWFDAQALGRAMRLAADEQLLLTQTVGRPARAASGRRG